MTGYLGGLSSLTGPELYGRAAAFHCFPCFVLYGMFALGFRLWPVFDLPVLLFTDFAFPFCPFGHTEFKLT